MAHWTLEERAAHYRDAFPRWKESWPNVSERWLWATWIIGSNYKGSGFYGSFPPRFLDRVMSMFGDAQNVLHLFSGSLPPGDYTRFDMVTDADVVGNAEELSKHFAPDSFDLIIADPPYHPQAAKRYGTPMPNRLKVTRECYEVLSPGGYLLWLDTMLPMFRKNQFEWRISIGIFGSTNHRVRGLSGFQRRRNESVISDSLRPKLYDASKRSLGTGEPHYVHVPDDGSPSVQATPPKHVSGRYILVDGRDARGYTCEDGKWMERDLWRLNKNGVLTRQTRLKKRR